MNRENIEYTAKYYDDQYEYRQAILPRELGQVIKDKGLLSEQEWRKLGVTQSKGWVHYDVHLPEPHILLFRRLIGTDPTTGKLNSNLLQSIREEIDYKRRNNICLLYTSDAADE